MTGRLFLGLPYRHKLVPAFGGRTFRTALRFGLQANPRLALTGLQWFIRRKRVRGWRMMIEAASFHDSYYQYAIEEHEAQVRSALLAEGGSGSMPRIACLIVEEDGGSAADRERTVQSVRKALGDQTAIGFAKLPDEAAQHEWTVLLRAGDTLSPLAGSALSRAIAEAGDATAIYWDEDEVGGATRRNPWFKPCWDEQLNQSRNLLAGSAAVRTDRLRGAGDIATLTVDTTDRAPLHLPLVLTHGGQASREFATVRPPHPERWPAVTIIIPTRDRPDLLRACLKGLDQLNYQGEVELLVVDNGTVDSDARALIEAFARRPGATLIRDDGAFNYSRINNLAVKQARGEFVCLLNNDVEAVEGDWLSVMMTHALLPSTGAVGAMLLYPDGSIQHAGVAIGSGGAAGHIERHVRPEEPAYYSWHAVSRTVSAVTGACLLVSKRAYLDVGGLDENHLPVAFNDVDLCLKLQKAGLRNRYVAEARLIHHESQSRGTDVAPDKARRFAGELQTLADRWHTATIDDPCFHPIFSRASERCVPFLYD